MKSLYDFARSVNLHQCGVNALDRNRDAETVLLELCDVAESERSTVFANAGVGIQCRRNRNEKSLNRIRGQETKKKTPKLAASFYVMRINAPSENATKFGREISNSL